jgi:hypothetical protein
MAMLPYRRLVCPARVHGFRRPNEMRPVGLSCFERDARRHAGRVSERAPARSHLSRAQERVLSHRHGMTRGADRTHALRPLLVLAVAAAPLAGLSLGLARCGGESNSGAAPHRFAAEASVSSSDANVGPFEDAPASMCDAGWECKVDSTCAAPTTLSGKVFDPTGAIPLPNIVVFIPADPASLPAIGPGSPTCTNTVAIGQYVAATETDGSGAFTLAGVPTGTGVPVTVQMGKKWRRTVYVNVTNDCGANTVADGTLRLPRSHVEGEMPQMAVLTGGSDNIACFLRGIGIDDAEFQAPGGPGRVDVYRGVGGAGFAGATAGDCTGTSCPLWDTPANLSAYDVVLLGCEGGENLQTKPASAIQTMHDWLMGGGKLFGVHYQDVWLSHGPADVMKLATWIDGVDGGASGGSGPFSINTGFPGGALFREWSQATGAADVYGDIPITPADVATSVSAVESPARAWIFDQSTAVPDGAISEGNVKALSVALPYTADAEAATLGCGNATLTDIHPGGTVAVSPLPSACPAGGLSAEEKALEFLFFEQVAPQLPGCSGCPPPPPPPPFDGG